MERHPVAVIADMCVVRSYLNDIVNGYKKESELRELLSQAAELTGELVARLRSAYNRDNRRKKILRAIHCAYNPPKPWASPADPPVIAAARTVTALTAIIDASEEAGY